MQRTCCLDFGNTRLKCALFEGREMQELLVLENDDPDTLLKIVEDFDKQPGTIWGNIYVGCFLAQSLVRCGR